MEDISGRGAATELCRRLQAGTKAVAGTLGGWPPYDRTIAIVAGFLAEYGLHIDDEVWSPAPDQSPDGSTHG